MIPKRKINQDGRNLHLTWCANGQWLHYTQVPSSLLATLLTIASHLWCPCPPFTSLRLRVNFIPWGIKDGYLWPLKEMAAF